MTPKTSTHTAPGKVILLGEHAVGHGQPAIALPVDRRLTLTTTLSDGNAAGTPHDDPAVRTALATAAALYSLPPDRLTIRVTSDIPAGRGLGSSAALTVALLRTLADLTGRPLDREELLSQARTVEAAFHGTSSGLDAAAVGLGGVIWFRNDLRPRALLLPVKDAFDLVVAVTPERRSTAREVTRLHQRLHAQPALYHQYFSQTGSLSAAARDALRTGDLPALGHLMDQAQNLLARMGVSTPGLEHAITTARTAGALGAKLTGAGGGGAIVALASGNAADVTETLQAEGYETFTNRVGAANGADALSPLK
ncbi:mevalonate kinase [Streptomyces laurentii]|uniref:mevalonate kinase n=1 Tax=Streptomyces laurentii TaxID=39478 RepID=UPI0036BEBE62